MSKWQNFFFHQKSQGIAFTLCRYLNQNMRAFIFCRYCPPIVLCSQIWKTKRSSKIEGNTLGILRRSFFPSNALGMPSFNNSGLEKLWMCLRTFRYNAPSEMIGRHCGMHSDWSNWHYFVSPFLWPTFMIISECNSKMFATV